MQNRLVVAGFTFAMLALQSCGQNSGSPVQPIRPFGSPEPTSPGTPKASPIASSPATATPTASPTPTAVPTQAPTATPTPIPTHTPTPTPTTAGTTYTSACINPSGGGDATRGRRFSSAFPYIECDATVPFSDTISQIGVQYLIDFSNATEYGSLTATLYRSNPGAFSVPGTVVAAVQGTLTNSPSVLTVSPPGGSISIELGIFTEPGATGGLPNPGAPYTCSVFVDSTLIGRATTTSTGGDSTYCYADYNSPQAPGEAPYVATVTLPNALDVGHPYTLIVSQ